MTLLQLSLLLLLLPHLSHIFIYINGESEELIYKCTTLQNEIITISHTSAELKNGCVIQHTAIIFDINAMYDAATKIQTPHPIPSIIINISDINIINSYININNIPDDTSILVPLLFTMRNSKISGASKMIFGGENNDKFKLPSNSRIIISHCEINIITSSTTRRLFTFHSLQLLINTTMEISNNIIKMERNEGNSINIFYLPGSSEMVLSDKSKFILSNNNITMIAETGEKLYQYVWYQQKTSALTISKNSEYTWKYNNIKLIGSDINTTEQYIWYGKTVIITISEESSYTWVGNNINMEGYNTWKIHMYVWYQGTSSPLLLSQTSSYKWISNIITMLGYDISKKINQYIWDHESSLPITITKNSVFTWIYNNISIIGRDLNITEQYIWYGKTVIITISEESSYTWVGNSINMEGYNLDKMIGYVWYQETSSALTISETSIYKWMTNIISMKGYDVTSDIKQYVSSQNGASTLTISKNSNYTWIMNSISMLGYKAKYVYQYVLLGFQYVITLSDSAYYTWSSNIISMVGYSIITEIRQHQWYCVLRSALSISENSNYTWAMNSITMKGYDVDDVTQYMWYGNRFNITVNTSSIYTWVSNNIIMTGYNIGEELYQWVWDSESDSSLTISDTGTYTWASNAISMVGYSVKEKVEQYLWFHGGFSHITVSVTSSYTLYMNSISMDGHDAAEIHQNIWNVNSPTDISQISVYEWVSNIISMKGYGVEDILQNVWYAYASVTISDQSKFLITSNMLLLLAKDYEENTNDYILMIKDGVTGTISKESTMVWKDNCIGFGHETDDKRHVFGGKWSITGEGSELLLDGNYFTTTDKHEDDSSELTQFVWGPTWDTINTGTLTIKNNKVYTNSDSDDVTGSMLWTSSPFTSNANVKQPTIQWASSPAKDENDTTIPTLDNSNLRRYMCVGLANMPPVIPANLPPIIPSIPNPNTPRPGIPNPNTPSPGIPNPNTPSTGIPNPNTPRPGIPNPNTPSTGIPNPNTPSTGIPNPNTPSTGIPNPNTPRPGIPNPNTPSPGIPNPNTPSAGIPNPPIAKPIPRTIDKPDTNATAKASPHSGTSIRSTIPSVVISSVVFLYLCLRCLGY